MTRPIDLDLLARNFEGTATPEEAERVRSWIGDDPERLAAVAALGAEWVAQARRLHSPYDAGAAWTRISAQLPLSGAQMPKPRRSADMLRRTWHSSPVTAWAAAVVFTVAIGAWWMFSRTDGRPIAQVAATQLERTYRTARAQRAIVRLSDGSEVTLNAASQLRVPADFGIGRRDLFLEGEAYFNVAPDSAAFIVHTSRGLAHDLGTRFNVRAYAEDGDRLFEVVVAEGAVAIARPSGGDSLVLRAAEAGWLTSDDEIRARRGVDVRSLLGWIDGRLEFRNEALGSVLPALSRWYDADVRVDDPVLAGYPITVTLTGERFEQAVQVVARALNARVVRRGTQTVFVPTSGGAQ